VASTLKRPPFAVFTKVKLVPDPKTQVAVTFELLGPAPATMAEVLLRRHKEAEDAIVFPYPKKDVEQPKKGSAKKRKF
jgi:hypothetical protein